MQKIKINLNYIKRSEVDLIVNYLKRGNVIVYPTDTIYGLGCLATNKKAINRIFKIKQRAKGVPLIVLASSIGMVKKYCLVGRDQADFLKKNWPEPMTFILPSSSNLPKELHGAAGPSGGLAVRLPKNKFLSRIIKRVGVPIVSTSANIHGQKNIINVNSIEKIFKKAKPDLVVDAGTLKGKPSKLVDIRDINNVKILRK